MRILLTLGTIVLLAFAGVYTIQQSKTKDTDKTSEDFAQADRAKEITVQAPLRIETAKLFEINNKQSTASTDARSVQLSDAEKDIVLGKSAKSFAFDTLVLLAEVDPPRLDGKILQASDIYLNELSKGTRVYISYNMRGEQFAGAVQIIDIGTGENGATPKLIQTVVYNDFDVHSLTEKNGYLYLAGATGDAKFKTPAALEIIKLDSAGKIPQPYYSKRIDLPSFAATSVVKVKDQVFVSTGDRGGGVVEINNPLKLQGNFTNYTDTDHRFYPLEDARYLAASGNYILCVKGTDAGLWVLPRDNPNASPNVLQLKGATIHESKSTVEVSEKGVLLALGDGGAQLLDSNDLHITHMIPQVIHPVLERGKTVTNAASGYFKELYTADGEAGARVFDFSSSAAATQIASINFGAGKSVNAIKYFNGYLIMAAGEGGVKIAKLYRKDKSVSDAEQRAYDDSAAKSRKDD